MPLVPAICTQCGAQIEVDDTHEAGICKACGTAFITENAINNYATYVTNNNIFNGATIIQEDGFQKLVNAAEGYLKLGDLSGAKSVYQNIINDYPQKFEGWYGLWCLEIEDEKKNLRVTKSPLLSKNMENAKKLASSGQMVMINTTIDGFMEAYNRSIEKAKERFNAQFKSFEFFEEYVKDLNKLISCTTVNVRSEVYYKKGELVYDRIIMDYRSKPQKAYVYKILGYNPEASKFVLADNVKEYVYGDYERELAGTLYNYCNIELYAADYLDFPADDYSNEAKVRIYLKEIDSNTEREFRYYEYEKQAKAMGCYIATCVYGSYDCPEVWTLRRFRDYTLDETWYGRAFVKCYYAVSPTLVKWFGKEAWFIRFWKKVLDSFVRRLNNRGVENTKYQDKY